MDLPFLQAALGAIVWVVANVVYVDLKRKGLHGFTRFAAFWAGTPTTWITFFAVPEGKQPTFHAPLDDDEAELLAEIRRDRSLREPSDDIEGGGAERPSHRP
jgi:hypothetical protein